MAITCMHAQGLRRDKVRDFALVYLLLWMTNERFVCSERHWYRFCKVWRSLFLVDLRILVPNLRTCRQRMFGRKNTEHTNVRRSLFTVLGLKCQEGARLPWPLPLSCPVFSSLFSLVSLLSLVYFILYNFVYRIFYFLLFIFYFFLFFFMILVMLFVCSILLHGFFAVYVCFFSFLFFFYFSILGVHLVRLWFVSFASLRTVKTVVILLSSQKKNKTKCSRIQEYGISTCTKISAITVVSPLTYPVKETIKSSV